MFEVVKICYKSISNIDNDKYESILQNIYSSLLEEGDCTIDIGAHMGRHTIPMANAVGNQGTVYAFEPLPHLYEKLQRTLETEKLDGAVQLSQYALSREEGQAEFLHVDDAPGLSGLKERTSHEGHQIERIQVDVKLLDNMIPEGERIKFIKIDAEGADFYILQGATRILSSDRPLVVFESGRINAFPAKSYGYSEEEFNDFFKSQSYVLYDIAGFKYDSRFWNLPTLNDFVAIPEEKEEEYRELLLAAVLTEFGKYAIL